MVTPRTAIETPPATPSPPPLLCLGNVDAAARAQAMRLQAEAFRLPETGAPPCLAGADELRVATADGRVVSCLNVVDGTLLLRGAPVSMGGIRHVATDPAEQNRGYAGALLRETLRELCRRRVAVSVLFPFSFRYYRKFGFELGGNHCRYWTRPGCIPRFPLGEEVRTAVPADAAALRACRILRTEGWALLLERSEQSWRRVLADPSLTTHVAGRDRIDGYAVTREERDSYGGRLLRVLEMGALNRRAWRALLGVLGQFDGEAVEWHACPLLLQESGLLRSTAPLREGYKPRGIVTVRPLFQVRLVNLRAALAERFRGRTGSTLQLELRVRDEVLPENAEPVVIARSESGVRLRAPRGREPWLETSVQTLSQIFAGYLPAVEAVLLGQAKVSGDDALEAAEELFPTGEPFLSELDRF